MVEISEEAQTEHEYQHRHDGMSIIDCWLADHDIDEHGRLTVKGRPKYFRSGDLEPGNHAGHGLTPNDIRFMTLDYFRDLPPRANREGLVLEFAREHGDLLILPPRNVRVWGGAFVLFHYMLANFRLIHHCNDNFIVYKRHRGFWRKAPDSEIRAQLWRYFTEAYERPPMENNFSGEVFEQDENGQMGISPELRRKE